MIHECYTCPAAFFPEPVSSHDISYCSISIYIFINLAHLNNPLEGPFDYCLVPFTKPVNQAPLNTLNGERIPFLSHYFRGLPRNQPLSPRTEGHFGTWHLHTPAVPSLLTNFLTAQLNTPSLSQALASIFSIRTARLGSFFMISKILLNLPEAEACTRLRQSNSAVCFS